jgi:hypothetical protein
MRIETNVLDHINITRFAKYVAFNTCDIAPEAETKIQKGMSCLEKMITEMLSQDVLPYAIRFGDVAQLVGTNEKDAKRLIRGVLKLGQESYDGTYGRPATITPEHALYITTALIIQEYGRKINDLDEFVVRYNISDFLDIGAIETEYDMACYAFLIDYFESCLKYNKKLPLLKYLKENGNSFVTSTRLKRYFERNDWYGDLNLTAEIGFPAATPKVSDVTSTLVDIFFKIREVEKEINEEWELDQAFKQ